MRALARLVLTLVLLVIALGVGYYWGYHAGTGRSPLSIGRTEIGTSGSNAAEQAREGASAIGDKIAAAGSDARDFISDAALTAKIKSKMQLDDTLQGSSIGVSTSDRVVTLTGTAGSPVEHERALQLARETKGVKSVVDRIGK